MTRAIKRDMMDTETLLGITALVAAAGAAQAELHALRERTDPWATPHQLARTQKLTVQSTIAQLAGLMEVVARHRLRRSAGEANSRQRAAQAVVARELEVRVPPVVGHSGDATELHVKLENRSSHDLRLRLNVALPTGAWAVLEPQARGSKGLVFAGPIDVPARTEEHVGLVLYVPTTVRLDAYVVPIEVVPEPREIVLEQGGVDA
jgi:hypothetical protein